QASIRSDIQSVTVEPEPEAQPVSAREAVTASTNSGSNSNSSSNSSRSTSQGSTKKKKSTKSSNNVPAPTRNGGTAISRATSQIGKADYQLGAMSPNNRFDCSGLVGWAYGMGRENTGSLRAKSTKITEAQAQPGDLIFFGPN